MSTSEKSVVVLTFDNTSSTRGSVQIVDLDSLARFQSTVSCYLRLGALIYLIMYWMM